MRILFDQGTPVPLVNTAYERGWSSLRNGDLLDSAEQDNYEIFVTTDRNLRHQQDLRNRRIAVVVLSSTSWPRIERAVEEVVRSIDEATPGTLVEVVIP